MREVVVYTKSESKYAVCVTNIDLVLLCTCKDQATLLHTRKGSAKDKVSMPEDTKITIKKEVTLKSNAFVLKE